ncbi:MAG TPA: LUD domain-containing protein [Chitinophagaceae bacterium]|nr:LUD domain-containing protein [Chitinophagaceae bacterium]
MDSRELILQAVLHNQPELTPLPDISIFQLEFDDVVQKYIDIFTSIGGEAYPVTGLDEVKNFVRQKFAADKRIITTLPELNDIAELYSPADTPHSFADVELAIIKAHLAVAENGAVWLTDEAMGQRIIPYICQYLIVLIGDSTIVASMHNAYTQIGQSDYGFGGFIGGPSKTADIEQALVLGAHGPLSMTVFIIQSSQH